MRGLISENVKIVNGLSNSADIYNGNPVSDAVDMGKAGVVLFELKQQSAGTNTGTATVTLEACTDSAGAGAEPISFFHRKKTTGASDIYTAIQQATIAGFVTTANEDTTYLIETTAREANSEAPDKRWLRLKLTETVNDPVMGSVSIWLDTHVKGESIPSVI